MVMLLVVAVQQEMIVRGRGYQLVQRIAPSGVVTVIGICIQRPGIISASSDDVVDFVVVRDRRVVIMMGMVAEVVVFVVLTIEVVMYCGGQV